MKKVIKVILISLLFLVQTGCETKKTFDNDIDLYNEIRNNTLNKKNYCIYSESNAHNYYSDQDQNKEGSGEITLQKTILVEDDKKIIQDTLIRDDYVDTFYIIEYGDRVYDEVNNQYIDNKEQFYESRGYFLPEKYLLDKDNIKNITRIDDTHIEIEFNEKINDLGESIIRSYLHDSKDGSQMTKFEVSKFVLSYTNDYLLDDIKMDIDIYFDNDDIGSTHNIYIQVSKYDEVDLPLSIEDATVKPERQYFSMGYVDKDENLVTNDMVHPGQNIAIAYFNVQFENDEFDLENPYGIVKFFDCSSISLDDYNNGKNSIEYSLVYDDDKYTWISSDSKETFPYLYRLYDDYFILQINNKDFFFNLDSFIYTNQ